MNNLFDFKRLHYSILFIVLLGGPLGWGVDFQEPVRVNYSDLICSKGFRGDQSRGGGALILEVN